MGEDIEFMTVSDINHNRLQCAFNYFLFPAKICYFLKQAKFAVMEYTMLFYINIGLNPAEAGMINGIQNIGGVIGAPVWALVADKLKIHKPLCILLSIMSMITFCIQPIISILFGEKYENQCPVGNNNITDSLIPTQTSISNHQKLFYGLLLTSVTASSFDGSVMSFIDSAVIQKVQLSPVKSDFGKQRTLGCIGTAVGSYLFAFGIQFFPVNLSASCYTGVFVGYFLFSSAFTIGCNYLFKGLVFTKKSADVELSLKAEDVTKLLWQTLKQFETIFFFLNVLILGVLQASYYTFTYLYLQQELNAPTLLFPISMTVCSITGCIVYYNGSRVVELVNGTQNAFCIICFFWVVRFVSIAYLTNPFYILFTDTLNALTYSLSTICIMEHIRKISDPTILTTMSGFVNCLYNYLGYFISSVVGGLLIRLYGGKTFFILLATLSSIWLLIIICYVVTKMMQRRKSNYQPIR